MIQNIRDGLIWLVDGWANGLKAFILETAENQIPPEIEKNDEEEDDDDE